MSADILTTTEAAALLCMHPKTLLRQARQGAIPAARVGGRWKFSRQQLLRWLEGGAGRPAPQLERLVVEGEEFVYSVCRRGG